MDYYGINNNKTFNKRFSSRLARGALEGDSGIYTPFLASHRPNTPSRDRAYLPILCGEYDRES
jgi:hypothetical protein